MEKILTKILITIFKLFHKVILFKNTPPIFEGFGVASLNKENKEKVDYVFCTASNFDGYSIKDIPILVPVREQAQFIANNVNKKEEERNENYLFRIKFKAYKVLIFYTEG